MEVDLFFLLLVCLALSVHGAPVNNTAGEFVSLVAEGSKEKCGYRSFGPAELRVDFDTVFKPMAVSQWINATAVITPTIDILAGEAKVETSFWPYKLRFPFCDLDHGEEYCPIVKGQPIVIPFQNFAFQYYLIPAIGHHTVAITAVNEKNEIALRVEVECTIHSSIPKFPGKGILH